MAREKSNRNFWQSRYREGNIPWDLGESSQPVRWLIDRYFPKSGNVLIPGCGRGHEALYLAEQGYGVTAIDLIAEPLAYLRKEARKRKLRIEILQQDIFNLPVFYDLLFDVFLEQTFFCAIDPSLYEEYEALAYRTLRPGGQFLGVFMEVPWDGGPPYNCPPDLVLKQFSAARWIKGKAKPFTPQNPARPGPEYTLRLIKQLKAERGSEKIKDERCRRN